MNVMLRVLGSEKPLTVAPSRLVVAGYTARDTTAVEAHISELEAIGVPRPPSVPAFYELDPALLTTRGVVEVASTATSGEVEPVVIRRDGRYFLGVGSDHTDRDLERTDIAASKAACPKPIGDEVVEVGSDFSAVEWDGVVAESAVDDQLYQRGSLAELRHPNDLMARMAEALDTVTGDLVLFCGTLPLIDGQFNYGSRWRVRLELPGGEVLDHAYQTKQRSP